MLLRIHVLTLHIFHSTPFVCIKCFPESFALTSIPGITLSKEKKIIRCKNFVHLILSFPMAEFDEQIPDFTPEQLLQRQVRDSQFANQNLTHQANQIHIQNQILMGQQQNFQPQNFPPPPHPSPRPNLNLPTPHSPLPTPHFWQCSGA